MSNKIKCRYCSTEVPEIKTVISTHTILIFLSALMKLSTPKIIHHQWQIPMGMQHWWNDPDSGKLKYSDTNLCQCHFNHYKFHTDWSGIEPKPPGGWTADLPHEPWHTPYKTHHKVWLNLFTFLNLGLTIYSSSFQNVSLWWCLIQ